MHCKSQHIIFKILQVKKYQHGFIFSISLSDILKNLLLKKLMIHHLILYSSIGLGILLFHLQLGKVCKDYLCKNITIFIHGSSHSFCFLNSSMKICLFRFPECTCSSVSHISSSSLGNLFFYVLNRSSAQVVLFSLKMQTSFKYQDINVGKILNMSYKYFRLQLQRT